MRSGRAWGTGLALLVCLLAVSPALGSSIAGRLSGAPLPASPTAGRASVRAVDINTGAVASAVRVGAGGSYALTLPPGEFALESSVAMPGRPLIENLSAVVRVPAGAGSRRLNLTTHRAKKARRRRRGSKPHGRRRRNGRAHAAGTNPNDGRSYPGLAVGVNEFSGGGTAGWDRMKRGLPDMLTTDLAGDEYRGAATEFKPGCDWTVIDTLRRDEIEQEIALQQTPAFDPATRVEPGHLIPPDAYIDGNITLLPDQSALIVVVLHMAGKGGATLASATAVSTEEGVFAAEQDIVLELIANGLCRRDATPPLAPAPGAPPAPPPPPPPPPPPALPVEYTGSVSGSAEVASGNFHFEWSGSVTLQAVQDGQLPPQGAPAGAYRIYEVSEGSVQARIHGGEGECTYEGEGNVPLTRGGTSGTLAVQMGSETPAYAMHLAFDPSRTITIVKSGGEGCEEQFQLPVSGYFANSQTVLTSQSIGLSGTGEWPPSGYSSTTTHWSLTPVG